MEHVAPSVRKTAFNCPHCDALAHQSWYLLGARQLQGKKSVLPPVTTNFGLLQTDFDSIGRTGDLSKNSKWVNAMAKGYPFTEPVRVLRLSSVGEITLRLYSVLSYSQNSARDLRFELNGA